MKKHLILIGIFVAILLMFIAAMNYPGGSNIDPSSVGYDWKNNYISNLLSLKSINGFDNTARPWAIGGVLFLSVSMGLFFFNFSENIKVKSASNIIKYAGVGSSLCGLGAVIPSLHDIMVTFSSILALFAFFYVTVFVVKSKLLGFKIMSILFLAIHYFACYMYFTRTFLDYLPIVQKAIHLIQIVWILGLVYFTRKEDFEYIKN